MQTFKVRHWEALESPPQEPFGGVVETGFQAPGRVVLVVREGTAWVQREDSTRETVGAKGVVMYDAGDWIEYGSDGSGEAFQAELYGEAEFSEEQQSAGLARFLGQADRP
jgi:hypothetical protein